MASPVLNTHKWVYLPLVPPSPHHEEVRRGFRGPLFVSFLCIKSMAGRHLDGPRLTGIKVLFAVKNFYNYKHSNKQYQNFDLHKQILNKFNVKNVAQL